ncbi:hypothetical protein BJ912DRAFT_955258 [Pholiota molesta]|nr:hypothetical protein BJ912DRAFT_955258 [Pholiota molesta]
MVPGWTAVRISRCFRCRGCRLRLSQPTLSSKLREVELDESLFKLCGVFASFAVVVVINVVFNTEYLRHVRYRFFFFSFIVITFIPTFYILCGFIPLYTIVPLPRRGFSSVFFASSARVCIYGSKFRNGETSFTPPIASRLLTYLYFGA